MKFIDLLLISIDKEEIKYNKLKINTMKGVLRKIKNGNDHTWKIIKNQNYWIDDKIDNQSEIDIHPDSLELVKIEQEFQMFDYEIIDGKAKLKC